MTRKMRNGTGVMDLLQIFLRRLPVHAKEKCCVMVKHGNMLTRPALATKQYLHVKQNVSGRKRKLCIGFYELNAVYKCLFAVTTWAVNQSCNSTIMKVKWSDNLLQLVAQTGHEILLKVMSFVKK